MVCMSDMNARLDETKPGHEQSSGTGRELNSATLNTESGLKPENKPGRSDLPVVDVNMKQKASVIRRDTQAGVSSDSVESSAKSKRVISCPVFCDRN